MAQTVVEVETISETSEFFVTSFSLETEDFSSFKFLISWVLKKNYNFRNENEMQIQGTTADQRKEQLVMTYIKDSYCGSPLCQIVTQCFVWQENERLKSPNSESSFFLLMTFSIMLLNDRNIFNIQQIIIMHSLKSEVVHIVKLCII